MCILMIDPPSGWMYGFPKPAPKDDEAALGLKQWLVDKGYPAKSASFAAKHCRYFTTEMGLGE